MNPHLKFFKASLMNLHLIYHFLHVKERTILMMALYSNLKHL